MNELWKRHQQNQLTDSSFLKSVDSLAISGYGQPDYYNSLQHFRQVAYSKKNYWEYRKNYYKHLMRDATVQEQTGKAIYYLEKLTDEVKSADPKALPELTMSSYLVGTYIYYSSFDSAISEYHKVLPVLETLPERAKGSGISASGVDYGMKTIAFAMTVSALQQDSAALGHAARLAAAIYHAAEHNKAEDFAQRLPSIRYYYYLAQYQYYKHYPGIEQSVAIGKIAQVHQLLRSPEYMATYQDIAPYMLSEFYMFAANEYLDANRPDSALHFLKLEMALALDTNVTGRKSYYLIMSKIKAKEGDYKTAYDYLDKVYKIEQEHITKIIADRDNNLYAQAQAQDQKELLGTTMQEKKISEDRVRFFTSVSLGLIAVAILLPLYLRQRQKAKFLHFKLNLARNIHDETNPALLYAKALAKSNREIDANGKSIKSELEQHLEYTMETIRSLSHDLKSENLQVIGDFSKEIGQILKKLSNAHGFSYWINDKAVGKKFLSYHQFTQLKAIVLECITNSIKHASFDQINLTFRKEHNKLYMDYNDNGAGWPADTVKTGIGLQNISERVKQINGELSIRNNFPDGYRITVAIPVRLYENTLI